MRRIHLRRSRFIAGIALLAIAFLMFVFGRGYFSTAGVVAFAVLGLVSIAISRR